MKIAFVVLALTGSLVFAQLPQPMPPILPPGRPFVPPANELKAHLGLTDQQMERLAQLQREKMEKLSDHYFQIAERQRTLARTLRESNADPTTLGRILLDINNLNLQIQEMEAQYERLAAALLTPDQRTKLRTLEDAVKLQPAISQAYAFDLLAGPGPIARMPFPGAGGVIGGIILPPSDEQH